MKLCSVVQVGFFLEKKVRDMGAEREALLDEPSGVLTE